MRAAPITHCDEVPPELHTRQGQPWQTTAVGQLRKQYATRQQMYVHAWPAKLTNSPSAPLVSTRPSLEGVHSHNCQLTADTMLLALLT
jgi:hypothetical protein